MLSAHSASTSTRGRRPWPAILSSTAPAAFCAPPIAARRQCRQRLACRRRHRRRPRATIRRARARRRCRSGNRRRAIAARSRDRPVRRPASLPSWNMNTGTPSSPSSPAAAHRSSIFSSMASPTNTIACTRCAACSLRAWLSTLPIWVWPPRQSMPRHQPPACRCRRPSREARHSVSPRK